MDIFGLEPTKVKQKEPVHPLRIIENRTGYPQSLFKKMEEEIKEKFC